jgi:TolB protein
MSSAELSREPLGRSPRSPLVVGLAAVALIVVVVVLGAWLISVAASPRPSAALIDGRIVVVAGDGGVRTIDATGAAERRFDVTAALAQYPAWSPDGHRLAIISLDDDGAGVVVVDDAAPPTATAEPAPAAIYRSVDMPPFYLFWSPDGRQVTFLTSELDGLALRSAPADGSDDGGVVRRGAPMYWDWTADDRMLVHAGGDGPAGFIGELRMDGSFAAPSDIMPGPFQAPAVSDDGRRAYVVTDVGGQAIVTEDTDGGSRRVGVTGATALDWSPSEAAGLAFVTPPGTPEVPIGPIGPLDILDTGSSTPRRLLDETVLAFFWSPDGASIAALALDTDAPQPVASRLPPGRPATGDPSGVRTVVRLVVLDAADGTITLELPVQLSTPFINQVLPFYDQYARSHSLWSPDSKAVVLPLVDDDDVAHIAVVPTDGRPPSIVADGEIAFWAPAPAPLAP